MAQPEIHIKRQVTQHDCLLPSLLSDGDKWPKKVYGDEKHILYWADYSNQGRTKISFTGTTSQSNQQRKDHLYSLRSHSAQFQQNQQGPPLSIVSLGTTGIFSLQTLAFFSLFPCHREERRIEGQPISNAWLFNRWSLPAVQIIRQGCRVF
jgi:hypothetical protein